MNRIFVHIWLLVALAAMPIHMSGQQPLAYPLDTIDGQIYYRYTVERSIGLYRLSVNFGVSQEEILRANPQIQKQGLRYDELILIPAKGLEVQPTTEVAQATAEPEPIPQPKPEVEKRRKRITLPQLKWEKHQNNDTVPTIDTLAQVVEDTISSTTFADSTAIRIALMLPLNADAIKRDKNIDRFYDFYAGALIAIYETQAEGQPLEIFTYDVGKGTDEVAKVMSELSANKVDAIIGPAYSQQVSLAIDSARKDSTWILVPFLPRVNNIEQNPFVIKFNPSPQVEADALAKYLAKRKDSMQCVLLEAKEDEVIPQGITALHQALKKHNVPTSTITLRAILTDSLNGLHPDKENILIFNTEKYNNLNTVIPHLLAACGKYRITLFSHYSWQTEKIILPQLYTSVFAKKCLVPDNYEELYRTYFNHELSSLQPRYDLLGYDLTKHLLQMLIQSQQDSLSNMREVIVNYPWAGTQANIHYQSVGEKGGFENKNVYIIHQ